MSPRADRHPAELGALTALDLEEGGLAILSNVAEPEGAKLAHAHPRTEQSENGQPGPSISCRPQNGPELRFSVRLHFGLG
jgi:hypothetical protein